MIDLRVTLKALTLAVACCYATYSLAQDAPEVLSEDAQVLLNRLGTLTAEEDAGEATRLAAEILERWTHSGSAALDLLLRRGTDAMEAGDYKRAISHLTALTDHAPDFAEGWNERATAFFLMEEYGAAIADIEQVLILEPRHFGALAGLGIILQQLGDDAGALRALKAAAQVYPAEENVNQAIERLEQQTGERTL
ncbi:Tetratricopeptide repeat-containing protein [Jannaschia faecimaris]|uniref:Tetratricopeptide repeat-containing protein n=1 Tax=Jannaschia faecimaris TaxID=1244108 RepID=A0A1H3QFH2_9RHOB|nr:tetratricopeptide repeat protein [Jannaschia faecimaris]SDZ11479.1 Tetratricopeptide repeat-containing protein [Jannaschia faecimaris]